MFRRPTWTASVFLAQSALLASCHRIRSCAEQGWRVGKGRRGLYGGCVEEYEVYRHMEEEDVEGSKEERAEGREEEVKGQKKA